MPTTDTRFPKAALIAGVLALSLAGGCSASESRQRAPVSSRPAQSSSAPKSPASPTAPETTPDAPATTLPPAPPGTAAAFGTGVSAQITAVAPITAVATAPGDIAGPALAITMRLTNGSTEAVNVDDVTVTATDATGTPASPVTGDQTHPFSGSIPPGAAQTATYPFRIPASATSGAIVVISYRAGVPVATLMM